MTATSALYRGRVMHRRLRPFAHRFVYRVFSLWLDLDELPELDRRLRLFGHNRAALFSFQDRDHGARDGTALRPWLDRALAGAGLETGGRCAILSYPRLLGYVFNPLSIWFSRDRAGRLQAVLYEVANTFGENHTYLIPIAPGHRAGAPLDQECDKRLYVSPFIGMAARYRFRLAEPGERLSVVIRQSVPDGPILVAAVTGRRHELTDLGLAAAFLAYPLMTLKVIGAIHFEALRLWLKGAQIHRRPARPDCSVTITMGPAEAPDKVGEIG